jgi:hypothetical protein
VTPDLDPVARWLDALDARHLASLTPPEVARALRALSSCYVERRGKLAAGAALETAGKRAAFALFYSPQHLIVTREVLRALPAPSANIHEVVDIGCGTGVAGAAWALHAGARRIAGYDRNAWAVAEANWTYRQLGLNGRASRADVAHLRLRPTPATAIVAAYTVNELADDARAGLRDRLLEAHARGAHVLVVEPIARRAAAWWDAWAAAFVDAGGRADEWRFAVELPARQRALARAAGLSPRELTARTLFTEGKR